MLKRLVPFRRTAFCEQSRSLIRYALLHYVSRWRGGERFAEQGTHRTRAERWPFRRASGPRPLAPRRPGEPVAIGGGRPPGRGRGGCSSRALRRAVRAAAVAAGAAASPAAVLVRA